MSKCPKQYGAQLFCSIHVGGGNGGHRLQASDARGLRGYHADDTLGTWFHVHW